MRRSSAAKHVNWLVYRLGVVKWTALLSLVGLSLWERPVWCIRARHAAGPHAPFPCDTPTYPGWGHTYMSVVESFVFEGVCLAVLMAFEAGHFFAGAMSRCSTLVHVATSTKRRAYSVSIQMCGCCTRACITFRVDSAVLAYIPQ